MTPETRRLVFRYGIAIDLVILATGVGMFLPPNAALLLCVFAAVVLLSAWKGGWQGGVTAIVLSVIALATMFDFRAMPLMLFAGATGIAVAVTAAAMRSRLQWSGGLQPADVPLSAPDLGALKPAAPLVDTEALERAAREQREEAEREGARLEAEREAVERAAREEREEAERERARLEAERESAERARVEAEAHAAREREEAERVAREEREAAERERARLEEEREAAERERVEAAARAAKEREEAERVAREEREAAERERARLEAEREAAERAREEAEARAAKEREEAERVARAEREAAERERARLEAEREAAERVARAEREAAERERARLEAEREAAERERARLEAEREAAEHARLKAEARAAKEREEAERMVREQREAAELERARLEEERALLAKQREETARAAAERAREEAERELQVRLEAERRTAEEKLQQELETARETMRVQLEEQLAAERAAMTREADARVEAERKAHTPPASLKPAAPKSNILDTVAAWFKREPRTRPNLNTKRVPLNDTASRKAQQVAAARRAQAARQPQVPKVRKPRLVLLEKRRGTADTILPKLRQRNVEVTVVERWVDAVDELLRVKPDAFFLDIEHPDFEKALRITAEKSTNLPIVLTGRDPAAAPPHVRYAAFAARPYDLDEIVRIAQQAMSRPDELLALQTIHRPPTPRPVAPAPPPSRPSVVAAPPAAPVNRIPLSPMAVAAAPAHPLPEPTRAVTDDEYEVPCFSCRVDFNAVEADWCSCLAKERTLVCTNCLSCFCKAPPAYKEKFWVQAPPKLFERKSAEARRGVGELPANLPAGDVTRPLVLTVEDDEEIQTIVQRVCSNLGYGFIYALNGQDGLDIAREYRPNLILSDAFMPKLDGREMCRMLKEDPEFAETRMVIMTGLYTDTKYRTEAVKRFHVDDYVAKPVAITDLINILQRHLEGVTGLPVQDDLHEMHRRDVDDDDDREPMDDVPLSEVLAPMDAPPMQIAASPRLVRPDAYDVCCFNCEQNFDATHAEWCRCVGRDNTLACTQCGGCFCKAPAPYKERFWMDAPPSLFERKMIGSKRNLGARANPPANDIKRPLILLVEDDENVQLIVRTVVTTMGYGFVVGANGQEGLSLAREYSPDLILSDAFMPKLDGREMCRLLKEDPTTARSKAIIMTGLYTDRKYRNEALDYFKVDDYVAKPLAVDDLIKLFKKHLPQEVATAH